jgi:large subunit ribosomal protein L15
VDLSQLTPPPGSRHRRIRVGRGDGSGKGTYSGKGRKGQKARSGPGPRRSFEGGQLATALRFARKRGFSNAPFRVEYEWVNVGQLGVFDVGQTVAREDLLARGIVHNEKKPLKVLAEGEITLALTVRADRFSKAARQKIEAAGGTVVELNPAEVDGGAVVDAVEQ